LKYPLDTDRSGLAQKAESNKTKVTETGGTFKSQIPQEVNKIDWPSGTSHHFKLVVYGLVQIKQTQGTTQEQKRMARRLQQATLVRL